MPLTFKASPTNNINPWANKRRLGDFWCQNYYCIWQSKKASYNHVSIGFGIRRSDKLQWFPIWNMSHNCQKALLFGFWKFYFEMAYHW